MLTESSIISPVMLLGSDSKTFKPTYNYAYISDFYRYYFINDISWDNGFWRISLDLDALATYETQIRDTTQYVLRSASLYDGDIIDSVYTTKPLPIADRSAYSKYKGVYYGGAWRPYWINWKDPMDDNVSGYLSNYFNKKFNDGEFCVGIIGNNTTGVSYYQMSYSAFKEFINKAFVLQPSDMSDVSTGIANAIYDPIQYISFCRWYPRVDGYDSDTDGTTAVKLGAYTISLSNTVYRMDSSFMIQYYIDIDLPVHPKASDYPYLKMSPFTEYNVFIPPFGNIPIDSTKVYGDTSVHISWVVDFKKGTAHLRVHARPLNMVNVNLPVIYDQVNDFGVDIPISSMVMDWKAGLGISALTWLKNNDLSDAIGNLTGSGKTFSSARSKSAGAAAPGIDTVSHHEVNASTSGNTDLIDKAIGVLSSALGQVHTAGAVGSFLPFNMGVPYVYAFFVDQVEHDVVRYGAPLHQKKKLGDLSGFTICSNADIDLNGVLTLPFPTDAEQSMIVNFLNSGFYLE